MGQSSSQPIVMTTSATLTNSSVSGFGNSRDMSTPSSHDLNGGGVDLVGWAAARRPHAHLVTSAQHQQAGGHLASPRVVHADEQDFRHGLLDQALGLGKRLEALPGESPHED